MGAGTGDVIGLIVRRSLLLTAAGLGIGLAAAFAATRLLGSALFEVSATDPVTYAGVGLLLALVALMASYLPARRATRVDPVIALRYE